MGETQETEWFAKMAEIFTLNTIFYKDKRIYWGEGVVLDFKGFT